MKGFLCMTLKEIIRRLMDLNTAFLASVFQKYPK